MRILSYKISHKNSKWNISQKYFFKNLANRDPPTTNCADSSDSCIIERSTLKSSTALRRSLSKSRKNRFVNDLNMNSD